MPRLADDDPVLPPLVTFAAALAAGLTRDQVRHRVRSGRWTAIAKGIYRRNAATEAAKDPFAQARLDHAQAAAAQALRHPASVIGATSAACVMGLPVISLPPSRAVLIRPGAASQTHQDASIRGWDLFEGDVLPFRPPVTSVARTWLDVACTCPEADALALGDHLLREGLASPQDLAVQLARNADRRGVRRASRAASQLSALRESPLESASWAYFLEHGVPLPQMQVTIRSGDGRFFGRVDFLWPQWRLIGECDGRAKFDSGSALYEEKLREDELRGDGYDFARWGFRHLRTPALADRLRQFGANASQGPAVVTHSRQRRSA